MKVRQDSSKWSIINQKKKMGRRRKIFENLLVSERKVKNLHIARGDNQKTNDIMTIYLFNYTINFIAVRNSKYKLCVIRIHSEVQVCKYTQQFTCNAGFAFDLNSMNNFFLFSFFFTMNNENDDRYHTIVSWLFFFLFIHAVFKKAATSLWCCERRKKKFPRLIIMQILSYFLFFMLFFKSNCVGLCRTTFWRLHYN